METVTLFFYYEDWLKAVYWRAKTSLELSVRIYSCNGDGFLGWAARPAGRRGGILISGMLGAARGRPFGVRQRRSSTRNELLSVWNLSLTQSLKCIVFFTTHEINH